MLSSTLWLACLPVLISANVEKVVFVSPSLSTSPDLGLSMMSTLTPLQTTIRTQFLSKYNHTSINPLAPQPEAWFSLSNLKPDRRYEVRICWPATQPTNFEMELLTMDEIVLRPELLQLRKEAVKMQGNLPQPTLQKYEAGKGDSRLLLRVKAMADYFTMNQTLMKDGVVVDADITIVLDEYIWNLAPGSLKYTGIYLLATAIVASFVARKVLGYLVRVARVDLQEIESSNKKTA